MTEHTDTDNERIARAVGLKPERGVDGELTVYARLEGDALEHWHPCDFTTDWHACERWLVPWLNAQAHTVLSPTQDNEKVYPQLSIYPPVEIGEPWGAEIRWGWFESTRSGRCSSPTLAAAFCAAFIKYLGSADSSDSQEAKP